MSDLNDNPPPPNQNTSPLDQTPPSQWSLYLFLGGKRALLEYKTREFTLERELPAHQARLIVLLEQALREDQNLSDNAKGFRQDEALKKAYDENPRVNPPKLLTIQTYVRRLHRRLTKRIRKSKPLPPLIERVKFIGVRLLHPVKIYLSGRCINVVLPGPDPTNGPQPGPNTQCGPQQTNP